MAGAGWQRAARAAPSNKSRPLIATHPRLWLPLGWAGQLGGALVSYGRSRPLGPAAAEDEAGESFIAVSLAPAHCVCLRSNLKILLRLGRTIFCATAT